MIKNLSVGDLAVTDPCSDSYTLIIRLTGRKSIDSCDNCRYLHEYDSQLYCTLLQDLEVVTITRTIDLCNKWEKEKL